MPPSCSTSWTRPGPPWALRVDSAARTTASLDAHVGDLGRQSGEGVDRADLSSDDREDRNGASSQEPVRSCARSKLGARRLERSSSGVAPYQPRSRRGGRARR